MWKGIERGISDSDWVILQNPLHSLAGLRELSTHTKLKFSRDVPFLEELISSCLLTRLAYNSLYRVSFNLYSKLTFKFFNNYIAIQQGSRTGEELEGKAN